MSSAKLGVIRASVYFPLGSCQITTSLIHRTLGLIVFGDGTVFVSARVYVCRYIITLKGWDTMRVQTYASWVHRYAALPRADAAPQSPDELDGVIDTLIAQVPYYPSFAVQITPDTQGLLLQGSQRVVHTEEQADGMVVLRTDGGQVWIIQADYQRLVLA
jgi:hypothetical protein